MTGSLIQPLFNGPVDIVGDVHGEIHALFSLMRQMGYDDEGAHPEGRRLVFVGDLTDRGPDSPTVVDLVQHLVATQRAQCVLGNHELNILLGDRKHDNHWFFGEPWALDGSDIPTPAVLADEGIRAKVLAFFKSLPLALERDGLRVVHACWNDAVVDVARRANDAVQLYEDHRKLIDALHVHDDLDEIDRGLQHQNLNPVKVLTSGRERRTDKPFEASGKLRNEERVPWWEDYRDPELCVFGHYASYDGRSKSAGKAICIDYAVAKRWKERKEHGFDGTFKGKLAALRVPELALIFDDGEKAALDT